MRVASDKSQFTPFGLWLQEYCRQDISITNLDYVIEDYKAKKIMLLEEKQNSSRLYPAQLLTFDVLDRHLSLVAPRVGYEYWGFFLLQMPKKATMPGPGMTLNGEVVTSEQLRAHIDFVEKFCDGYRMPWRDREEVA